MKKKYYQDNLIEESKRAILKKYANDIRCACSNNGYKEYWIGEKAQLRSRFLCGMTALIVTE